MLLDRNMKGGFHVIAAGDRFVYLSGSLRKPQRQRQRYAAKQKVYCAVQWLCTCVIHLGTFPSRLVKKNMK